MNFFLTSGAVHRDDRQQKRNGGLRNLFEGNSADVDRRKEANAHGWGGEPDAEIQANDHAGVYRVDPYLHHRRWSFQFLDENLALFPDLLRGLWLLTVTNGKDHGL